MKPSKQSGGFTVYAMVLSFCLSVRLYVAIAWYSFVCHQRVLVGNWSEWPSSVILLAAVSGRSAAGPADHGCPRCFFPHEKVHPSVKFMLAAGAYSRCAINAPRLLQRRLIRRNCDYCVTCVKLSPKIQEHVLFSIIYQTISAIRHI